MPPRNSISSPRIPPPPAARSDDHPHINVEDLCVGCIIWLPPKDDLQVAVKCNKDGCCENGELDVGGYKHPVIVLSMKQQHGSSDSGDLLCCVACVTTYSDTKLPDYVAKRLKRKHLKRSLPIKDPEAPDIGSYGISVPEQLELEKGRRLQKQSYVRLDHNFEAPASMLRQYGFRDCPASKMRLTQQSYVTLMKELDLTPEVWYATKSLRKTARKRLFALAGPPGSLEDVSAPSQQPIINTPLYTPNEYSPPRPYVAKPSTTRPDTSVPVRPYNPVPARTYPAYQQTNNDHQYYGTSGPRRRVPEPEPEPDEPSAGNWFFGIFGGLILGTLALWRYGWFARKV